MNEQDSVVGRYARVSQSGSGSWAPYWYGKVVAAEGDYLKFERDPARPARWYHKRDVLLHPEQPPPGKPPLFDCGECPRTDGCANRCMKAQR